MRQTDIQFLLTTSCSFSLQKKLTKEEAPWLFPVVNKMAQHEHQYFGIYLRFYVYALHGYAAEVTYTALWELFVNQDLRCPGNSHIWAFFIYGISTLVIEKTLPFLKDRLGLPLIVRGLVYTVWTYLWEFSTGFILRQFDACPWNYEPWFDYHFMGLITFEYIPLWFLSSISAEKILVHYTTRLCFVNEPAKSHKD